MSEPRAALPMYARPETAAAEGRLWAGIWAEYPGLPERLGMPRDLIAHWQAPDLVFSQTCGLPYRRVLHGQVHLIGTPDFGLEGCPPGHYRSVLVMRRSRATSDPGRWAGCRFAYNGKTSQSGWAALHAHIRHQGVLLGEGIETGSHLGSLKAVSAGAAEIAAIDAQTWRLATRYEPLCAGLDVVGRTAPTPGLPYVTGPGGDPEALAAAIRAAIGALPDADRQLLGLVGLVPIPAKRYLAVEVDHPD